MSGSYKPYNVQCGCGVFNEMAQTLAWPMPTEADMRLQSKQVRVISERIANSSQGFKRQEQSFGEIMAATKKIDNSQISNAMRDMQQAILALK